MFKPMIHSNVLYKLYRCYIFTKDIFILSLFELILHLPAVVE